MRILITGAFGFLGTRLANSLIQQSTIGPNATKRRRIDQIVVVDAENHHATSVPSGNTVELLGDLSCASFVERVMESRFDIVFHLASLVSGGAEKDFKRGLASNLSATQFLLEECRRAGNCPTFVFSSSIAVYGGDLPKIITDGTGLTPQTSYGAHKAACELLIHDYSRKGYIDGRSVRLPIIIIRSTTANSAASSFASALFREPLSGTPVSCPVHPSDEVYVASADRAVEGLILAAESARDRWGAFSSVVMPGRTTSPKKMVAALQSVAGNEVAQLINWSYDPHIHRIVSAWPKRFHSDRAQSIGFRSEPSLVSLVEDYIRTL